MLSRTKRVWKASPTEASESGLSSTIFFFLISSIFLIIPFWLKKTKCLIILSFICFKLVIFNAISLIRYAETNKKLSTFPQINNYSQLLIIINFYSFLVDFANYWISYPHFHIFLRQIFKYCYIRAF